MGAGAFWRRNMSFTYTLTKGEIRDFRHIFHAALSAGAVVELTLPSVGSEAFSSSDQLEDWLRDDDNPYAEYEVRNLVKEPACL